LHQLHFLAHERKEFECVDFRFAAMLANRIQCRLEQIDVVHARNFDRILEGEEHAFAGALFGGHREQVFALERHRALRDFVTFATGHDLHERALARAVRAHDRVDFAGTNFKVQTFQDLLVFDADV
jgi:hypothetical protein